MFARQSDKIGNLVVVDAAEQHTVELDLRKARALRRLDALDDLAQVEILLGGPLDGVNRETAPGGQHTVLHLEGALEFVRSLLRNLLGQEQRLTQRTFKLQGQRLVHARGRRDVERIATLLKGRVAFQQPVRRT